MNEEFSKLKKIYKNISLGVFLSTIKGRFVDINMQFAKILGYDSINDVLHNIKDLASDLYFEPQQREKILKEIVNKKTISTYEVKFKKKNGDVIDVKLSIKPDENKEFLVGTAEDITARKKMKLEVEENVLKYRSLFESSNDAIYIVQEGSQVEFNKRARELFDVPSNVDSFSMEDVSPEYQPDGESSSKKAARYIQKMIKEKKPQRFEWYCQSFSGKDLICEVTINELVGLKDSFLAVVREITEKKKAEDQIVNSERKYREIFENSNDAIVIAVGNLGIEFNNKASEFFGIPDDVETISFDNVNPKYQPDGGLSSEKARKLIERVTSGESLRVQWNYLSLNGKEYVCDLSLNKIDIGIEGAYLTVIRDITEKKKAEEELKISEKRYRSIFEYSNDAIVIGQDNSVIEFNHVAKELFEFPQGVDKIDISKFNPVYQPDGKFSSEKASKIMSKVMSGEPQKAEWEYVSSTGKKLYCDISISKLEIEIENAYLTVIRDITEKKRGEEELKISERRYRGIFENSNDAIFIVHESIGIEFNRKARELFDIPTGINKVNLFDISPEYQPDGMKSLEKANKLMSQPSKWQSQKFEWLYLSYSKKKIYCDVSIAKLDIGIDDLHLVAIRDITKQKKAEIKLKESEERYRNLVDTSPVGILRTKPSGEFVFANIKMAEIVGFKSQKEVLQTYSNVIEVYKDKNDRDRILKELKKGKPVNTILEVYGKNKKTITVNLIAHPKFDDKGEIEFINSIIEDLSDRVLLEKELKNREELLTNIISSIPIDMWVLDNEKTIIAQSGYSIKKWGYFVNRKASDFLLEERKRFLELNAKNLKNNEIIEKEVEFCLDGDVRYSRKIIAPLTHNKQISGIIFFSVDLTELKRLQSELENHKDNLEDIVLNRTKEVHQLNKELLNMNDELHTTNNFLNDKKNELEELVEELKQTQQQLVQSEKMASIGLLTAGIAHEINNPINFISSGLSGLEVLISEISKILKSFSDVKYDENKIDKYLTRLPQLIKTMRSGVKRTTEIIKGLRTFSRLDVETKVLSDIHEIMDSTLVILENKLKQKITLTKDYKLDTWVKCYPGKMGQVFLNLLMNSIQAIESDGKIIISTQKTDNANKAIISIKDNGKGIPKKVKNKIFDPFFTTKPVGEGIGLGLSIVHGIIEEHEGKIQVSSEMGIGTEFIITLPIN